MSRIGRTLVIALFAFAAQPAPARADPPSFGPELQGFAYPWPVHDYAFASQGEALTMRYMDVAPSGPANGRTAVVLHGKNFCAATWEDTIRALSAAGYRVIAPDQIGFEVVEAERYQNSFQQLAAKHPRPASVARRQGFRAVAHSTGGMIAARYALMYPNEVSALVLVNPIGLEDWKALGVPWISVDEWTEREKAATAERIKAYEQATYYAGGWRPEYDRWVTMLAGLVGGPGHDIVARNLALIDDMIYTQPVVDEFPLIRVSTLLMIGDKDVTAIGKDVAPPAVRAKLGHYPELAQKAKAAIPGAKLIEFPDAGHAPQIQDPQRFNAALIEALGRLGR